MSNGLLSQTWCCCSSTKLVQFVPIKQQKKLFLVSDFKFIKNPTKFKCFNTNKTSNGPSNGESDSKSVFDAFFLGKALAEAVNERVESAVGEFLSNVGRLQAEQLKQVQEFQDHRRVLRFQKDEVLERAKKAKEMAAREAMEAQGVIRKPSTDIVSATGDDTESVTILTPIISVDSSTPNAYGVNADQGRDEDDSVSVPIDD